MISHSKRTSNQYKSHESLKVKYALILFALSEMEKR